MAARRRNASRRSWPANLYQNGAGYYWFKNPETGKSTGLGHNLKEALAMVKTANAELLRRKGDVTLLQKIDGAGATVSAWCDTYQKECLPTNRNSASSFKSNITAIKEADFAKQAISKVRPKDIADFIRDTIESRGPGAAIQIRTRLNDLFRKAIESGLLEAGKSPVDAVFKPTQTVSRSRLSLDEYKLIIAEARKEEKHRWIANAIELALVCGQRREDIANMTFSQIKDGFLWIEQAKGKEGHRSKLRIPLDLRLDVLGVTLGDVLKRCRDNVVSKSVIHYIRKSGASNPGDSCSPVNLSMKFAALRVNAGLTPAEGKTAASFHELRSLAARLYSEQYGPEFAQALLGHKSAEMTSLYRDSRGSEWTEVKLNAG